MFEWIISDIDGTFLKHSEDGVWIDQNTLSLFLKFSSKENNIVTFATGRHAYNAKFILERAGYKFKKNDYIIGLNGAQILSCDTMEYIYNNYLDTNTLHKISSIDEIVTDKHQYHHISILYGNKDIYFLKNKNPKFEEMMNKVLKYHGEDETKEFNIHVIEDTKTLDHIYKVLIFFDTAEFDYESIKKDFLKLNNSWSITMSSTYFMEIMNKNIDKSVALEYINNNFYNIEKDKMITFGDSLNDYEMFKWSGLTVTRTGASDKIKEIADYVIDAEPSTFVGDALMMLWES